MFISSIRTRMYSKLWYLVKSSFIAIGTSMAWNWLFSPQFILIYMKMVMQHLNYSEFEPHLLSMSQFSYTSQ